MIWLNFSYHCFLNAVKKSSNEVTLSSLIYIYKKTCFCRTCLKMNKGQDTDTSRQYKVPYFGDYFLDNWVNAANLL